MEKTYSTAELRILMVKHLDRLKDNQATEQAIAMNSSILMYFLNTLEGKEREEKLKWQQSAG
jgi:hypothetical protein